MPTSVPFGFRSGRYGTNARRELTTRLIASINRGRDRVLNVRAESDRDTVPRDASRFRKGTERNWRKDLNEADRRTAALVPSLTSQA
jgi:N-methylhydantoinase B/oxoprolinase/acetone carboxylase alpha subunit